MCISTNSNFCNYTYRILFNWWYFTQWILASTVVKMSAMTTATMVIITKHLRSFCHDNYIYYSACCIPPYPPTIIINAMIQNNLRWNYVDSLWHASKLRLNVCDKAQPHDCPFITNTHVDFWPNKLFDQKRAVVATTS